MYLPFYKQARMQHLSLLSENASYVVSFVYVDCLWYERAIVVALVRLFPFRESVLASLNIYPNVKGVQVIFPGLRCSKTLHMVTLNI